MSVAHAHAHGTSPSHVHAPETVAGPSGPASVVVDVGGDRGAVVVVTPADLVGEELEIRPAGRPWDGTHTAVRPRDVPAGRTYAGVFGSLGAGHYQLRVRGWPAGAGPVVDLTVTGGEVTQLRWPAG